jgi:hypothetical protein
MFKLHKRYTQKAQAAVVWGDLSRAGRIQAGKDGLDKGNQEEGSQTVNL